MSPAAADFSRPISPPPPHDSQNPTPVFPTSNGSIFVDKEGLSFNFSSKDSKPPRIRLSVKKTRGKVCVSNVVNTSLNLNLGNSSRDDQRNESLGNCENVGFAFGTNNSGSNGSASFVFGARNDSSHFNFCGGGTASGDSKSSSSARNLNDKGSRFVFVDDKVSLGGNLWSKDSSFEFCAGESPSRKEEGASVFCSTNTKDSALKPGFNNGDFLRGDSESYSSRCTKSSATREYFGDDGSNTFNSAGFVFGAKNDEVASDFGLGKKSSTNDSCAKSGGNDSDAQSDAKETLQGNGHSNFTTSVGTEQDVGGRKDHSGFSFGVTKDDSTSQLGKGRSRKYRRNSNFVSQSGKRAPDINDSQNPSMEEKPSSTESSDLNDEKKNSGASQTEFVSSSVKWSADATRSSSYKFVTGSSSSSGSAFYKVPLSKLLDDMKGLNIGSPKGISDIGKAKVVGNNSSFGTNGDFSFKASGKASGPVSGKENQTFDSAENILTRNVLNEHHTSQDNSMNRTSTTSAFSSAATSDVPQNIFGCDASSATAVKNKGNPVFATPPATADAGARDFQKGSFSFASNLFPEFSGKLEFCVSSSGMTDKWLKKTRRKSRQRVQTKPLNEQMSKEGSSPKTSKSPGCYSPMDFSPYGNATENVPHSTGTEKKEEYSLHGKQSSGNNKSFEKPEEQGGISFKFQQESKSKSSEENGLSAIRDQYKKKYKLKVGNGLSGKTPDQKSKILFSSAPFSTNAQNSVGGGEPRVQKGSTSNLHWKGEGEYSKQNSSEDSTHEECEQWRMRGNQAYKNRDLPKAEECYTNGINSVRERNVQGLYSRPLLLCYTNRAATRMYLRSFREALEDCKFAASVDHGFLKAKQRAANCHLMLGELQEAIQYYNYCLEPTAALLDRKVVIEASEGIQKAQQVSESVCRSANILQQTTSDAASSALVEIDKGLSISCYSERLLEMRGQSLFLLRRYDEVIELCEQTLPIAEKNFECKNSTRQWRWCLMSKCHFHLGRLEVAVDLIERLQNLASANDWSSSLNRESFSSLAATVRDLLHQKKSGNEAFQSGKHSEAVVHYTAAISSSLDSRPFAAICFCNRAAAHQALGLVADAIADCSVAIALDGDYVKAVSRRATLHELIRDYKQAISDLKKIISLLEIQSQSAQQSGKQEGLSASDAKELKRAQRRLALMEEKTKQEAPMDFYLILGIKASDSEADIKKAYKRAALKHHPDKACQYLARTDSGDDGKSWKDIVEKVHEDAERLFKMIGEAYAVLSDADKRSKYNYEEEIRNSRSDSKRHHDSGRSSAYDNSPYEKGHYTRRQQNYGNNSWTYERNRSRRYWQSYADSEDRW